MNFLPILITLSLGILFWFFDNFSNILGIKLLEGFFFAGGLHPAEQYIYITILSIISLLSITLAFVNKLKITLNIGLITFFIFLINLAISTIFYSVDTFESLREFFIYSLVFSIGLYTYNFVMSVKDKEEFLYNYSLVLLTIFIITIFIAVIVNLGLPTGSPWMSLFYQKNAFGGFTLIFIPVAFCLFVFTLIYKDYLKSLLFFVAFIFGIFSLLFSGSKASFLSFIVSLPFYLSFLRIIKIDWKNISFKLKIFSLVVGSLSLFLLILQLILDKKFTTSLIGSIKGIIFSLTNTVIARVDFWEASLKIGQDFLWGCGLYNFSKLYPTYQSAFYFYSKDPHNYYLKLISETGYISFIFFAFTIIYFLYQAIKAQKNINSTLLQQNPSQENSKFGTYILSSGISIGLIQSLIHIAFDVDFKFAYILIVFLINLFVNLAILQWLNQNENESENKNENKNSKNYLNIPSILWIIIFLPLSVYTFIYGIKEIVAEKIDKQIESTGNYKEYIQVINNSFPSSSKYVTLAELYRIESNFEESLKYSKKAIKLCKYNINAYLSALNIYSEKIETLLSIELKEDSIRKKANQTIEFLSKEMKSTVLEAFKYDNKNYPDLYIFLAKSFEYRNTKNYKNLYKNIFTVVYPPNEYVNLMDIRYTTFGDVIAEAYLRYLIEDFIKCQKNQNQYCQKITNYLYNPIIKYKLKTNINEFYLIAALSAYINAKKLYTTDYQESLENFKKAKNILELVYTKDFVNFYYYTSCLLYLQEYDNSLELSKIIFSLPLNKKMPPDDLEKLKIVKINNYAILSEIYNRKKMKNLSKKYEELYRKYSK